MRDILKRLWPELDWIVDLQLREQVTQSWIKALEGSPLNADDLNRIPFTLLVANCPITFMEHKRCIVHIARESALAMQAFMGRALPIDLDTVIAGAILADVGKLLEYESGPTARAVRARAAKLCVIPSLESRSQCNAAFPTRSATSSQRTPRKAI